MRGLSAWLTKLEEISVWRLTLEPFKLERRCSSLTGRVIKHGSGLSGELVDLALLEAFKMRLVIFLQVML